MEKETSPMRALHLLSAVLLLAGMAPAWSDEIRYPEHYIDRVDLPLPQSSMHLEAIVGDAENFEPIANFSTSNRYRILSNPVGRLNLLVEQDGKRFVRTCTAWLISPDMAMTNHHCVPGFEGRLLAANLVMGYLVENDQAGVKVFPIDVQPLETRAELDYAILRASGNPGKEYGFFDLSVRQAVESEEIFIIQHPAGRPKKLARRNCRIQKTENQDMQLSHVCDTLGGSSGSPVFSDNDMALIGLHHAGSSTANYAVSLRVIAEQSRILKPLLKAPEAGQPTATPAAESWEKPKGALTDMIQ